MLYSDLFYWNVLCKSSLDVHHQANETFSSNRPDSFSGYIMEPTSGSSLLIDAVGIHCDDIIQQSGQQHLSFCNLFATPHWALIFCSSCSHLALSKIFLWRFGLARSWFLVFLRSTLGLIAC